jgi:hypothetical protein
MRRLVPVVIAALALTLSACGSGTGTGTSQVGATKLIAASADKAAAAKTARMSGGVTIEARGQTKTLPLDGALDFETGAFQFTYDMGDLGFPGMTDAKIEARMVDGVMYMNLGELGSTAMTHGKSWLKMDFAALGLGKSSAGGLGNANPGGTLDALRGAGDVETVGTETVRGVETTHYRAMIDPKRAIDQAPERLRDQVRKGLETFDGTIPVDVWIDGDGQARKISMEMSNTKAGKIGMTMEYYDFGVAVNVNAPPADDVFDFSQIMGGLRGFAGLGTSNEAT